MIRKLGIALLTGALCALALAATDQGKLADEAYQSEDWATALELYRNAVESTPGDARAWYRLAVSARHTGEFDAAAQALDEAAKVGVPLSFTEAERARLLAASGRHDDVMAALGRALDAGFSNPDALSNEPLFAAFADGDEFAALVSRAAANKAPCASRAEFRQFDFWAGEWEVHDARDNLAGRNRITPVEGGCYLYEQWTGASGSTGSSINYYDAARGKWVQQWVSQGGTQIQIEGGLEDGSMVLVGKIFYLATGMQADFRGRWTPLEDGRVRQFFEQSNDGGETWTPWFEGFYTRVDPPAASQADS